MNTEQQIMDMQDQLNRLRSDFNELSGQVNKNNFTSQQDFTKKCNFTTVLKVPSYTSLPTGEVGHIAEVGGKLYICTTGGSSSVWTVVGTQS